MSDAAIRALLNEADKYPKPSGQAGFLYTRDQLIALLQECTPRLQSISVVPHHFGPGAVSFTITTHVSFDRAELDPLPAREVVTEMDGVS